MTRTEKLWTKVTSRIKKKENRLFVTMQTIYIVMSRKSEDSWHRKSGSWWRREGWHRNRWRREGWNRNRWRSEGWHRKRWRSKRWHKNRWRRDRPRLKRSAPSTGGCFWISEYNCFTMQICIKAKANDGTIKHLVNINSCFQIRLRKHWRSC